MAAVVSTPHCYLATGTYACVFSIHEGAWITTSPLPAFHCQYPTAVSHCALQMGPSGSGKTTLLDLLAGRKTVGDVQGSICFAGHKPSRQFLRRYTGYVEQFGEWPL
jgi:ABC-type uncharacterized transport system ATPase subunit